MSGNARPGGSGNAVASDVEVGTVLPEREFPLTRADLVRYAEAAGDPNPIHLDDAAARALGLPTVVAHGMLTMSLGAAYVAELIGDPGRIVEYAVRFTSPVYVPADTGAVVRFSGKVRSVDPEAGTAVIALTATSEGKRIFGRALATVRPG